MFRSQVEKISGVRKITLLSANAPGDFIFALSAVEALRAIYASTEIILLAQKEVISAALNLFFMKTPRLANTKRRSIFWCRVL